MQANPDSTIQNAKTRQRRMLLLIVGIVVGIHVLGLTVFGSLVLLRHFFNRDTTFVAPPEVTKRLDPRKLEHKVKVQKQQQKSGRPRIQSRLSAAKISEFSLPEIKTQAEPVKDALKSTLKSFGTSGVGTGTAGGAGSGGLGLGTSDLRFMGFNVQVDRVAILLDLSPSMLADERGGFDGFDALKGEMQEVVGALSSGSFFNLIAFDSGVDVLFAKALLANKENKEKATKWIKPLMADRVNVANNGTLSKNYRPGSGFPLLDSPGGFTRFDLALAAAFESHVDTLFIVTDGVQHIHKQWTKEELDEQEKEKNNPDERKQRLLKERQEAWQKERTEEAERRAKRGLPPRVREGDGVTAAPPTYSNQEVADYAVTIAKKIYGEAGLKLPKVYIIGYVTTPNDETFLKDLAQEFKSRFRRTRTLTKPIKE